MYTSNLVAPTLFAKLIYLSCCSSDDDNFKQICLARDGCATATKQVAEVQTPEPRGDVQRESAFINYSINIKFGPIIHLGASHQRRCHQRKM